MLIEKANNEHLRHIQIHMYFMIQLSNDKALPVAIRSAPWSALKGQEALLSLLFDEGSFEGFLVGPDLVVELMTTRLTPLPTTPR